ncbi:MAG: hypothetical protein LBK66_08120 [Spirochaetaceae bacterium]|jgi:hypothetical protein|nr:hypothetical protein [Spirochaetaceae bacterium]
MNEKKRWYDHKWAVRLLLILFYPAGIYGFIRASKKPTITMIITTLFYGGFWVMVFFYQPSPDSDTVVIKETETAETEEDTDQPLTLYQAAEVGDLKMVKRLLKKGEQPYIPPYVFSGIPENDEPENDAYYIAVKNGYLDIADEISKKLPRTPYWVGRNSILRLENDENTISAEKTAFFLDHRANLPLDDVKSLIDVYSNPSTDIEDRQICLTLLNQSAIFDESNNTYSEFGVDLKPYLTSAVIWERLSFPDLKSINQIAGKWEGGRRVPFFEENDEMLSDAYVFVSVKVNFLKNPKIATSPFMKCRIEVDNSSLLNSFIDLMSEQTGTPKILLGGKKKEFFKEMSNGMEGKYNSEHISGEIKIKGETFVKEIILSVYAFEHDFSKNMEMNANKDKIRMDFGPAVSDLLSASYLQIELDRN